MSLGDQKRERPDTFDIIHLSIWTTIAAISMCIWLWPPEPLISAIVKSDPTYIPGGAKCGDARAGRLAKLSSNEILECRDSLEQYRLQVDDLVQQARAAQAAEQGVRQAYAQGRISALQSGLSIFVFSITCLAAYAAFVAARHSRVAALESRRSADTAERALQASERPSLIIKEIDIHDIRQPLPQDSNDRIPNSFRIENSGDTSFWITGYSTSIGFPDSLDIAITSDPTLEVLFPLAPKMAWGWQKEIGKGFLASQEILDGLRSERLHLVIYGHIKYQANLGGREHELHFVYHLRRDDYKVVPLKNSYWANT